MSDEPKKRSRWFRAAPCVHESAAESRPSFLWSLLNVRSLLFIGVLYVLSIMPA